MAYSKKSLSRRALLGMLGGSAAALAAGCGGGAFVQTAGTVPDKYSKRTHVVLWYSFGGINQETLNALATKFNDAQDDIFVETQFQGSYETTMQKLATGIAARQIPDIVTLSEITWRKMHLADQLEPMNGYFDADLQPDMYIDQFIEEGTVKGTTWWIPFARSTPLFYFNKTLFAKAGLSEKGPESWEQLLEWTPAIMKQKTKAGNPKVMALGSIYASWYMQSNVWTWGGHWSQELEVDIASSPTMAAGRWMVDYIRKHNAAYLSQSMDVDLGNGACAAIMSSTGGLKNITDLAKGGGFELGTAFLPQHSGNFGCPTGGSGMGIMRESTKERKQAAWEFVKFLGRPENSAFWTMQTGYLPVVKKAQSEPDLVALTKKDPNFTTALQQLPKTEPQDLIRLIVASAGERMDQTLTKLYSGGSSVDEIFPRLNKQLQNQADLIRPTYEEHYA